MTIDNFPDKLKHVPDSPGVYRYLDKDEKVIYIGKAKSIIKRLKQYAQGKIKDSKTNWMLSTAVDFSWICVSTEQEALILEHDLIKQYKPFFNILLRDDKSYPYIKITNHQFPRLHIYRGKVDKDGSFYGPFPDSYQARKLIDAAYKIFKVRSCTDSFYKQRKRPCLQYQINRCTAPCVGFVDVTAYKEQVKSAKLLFAGKYNKLLKNLRAEMQRFAEDKKYEKAALCRNNIRVIESFDTNTGFHNISDMIDAAELREVGGKYLFYIMSIRYGRLVHAYYEWLDRAVDVESLVLQYILASPLESPNAILINKDQMEFEHLLSALSHKLGHNVRALSSSTSQFKYWYNILDINIKAVFAQEVGPQQDSLIDLQDQLRLNSAVNSVECFDVSHSLGENAYVSVVVADKMGVSKAKCRAYKLPMSIKKGDDYAALHFAVKKGTQID